MIVPIRPLVQILGAHQKGSAGDARQIGFSGVGHVASLYQFHHRIAHHLTVNPQVVLVPQAEPHRRGQVADAHLDAGAVTGLVGDEGGDGF